MKCKKCKTELVENSKYCHNCGSLVMTKLGFIADEIGEENLIAKLINKIEEFEERIKKLEQAPATSSSLTPWVIYNDNNPPPAPFINGPGIVHTPNSITVPGVYTMPYGSGGMLPNNDPNIPHIYFSSSSADKSSLSGDFSISTGSIPADSTININYNLISNRKE